ncbi:MAG: lysophospholipid acyltransferase family protein [Bacteroidales bacterium]|nr:lysophospholipid acyltransferase family protein [Bacteroidales bacterium]
MFLLSDILYFIAYHLVGYRRKVVRRNLATAFPEKGEKERRKIERRYYRHLCDLLVEGIYNLFASPRSIMKRYRVTNRELVNRYYEEGRTVVLMSAHYNNWEYMVTSLNMQLFHHGIGIGKALSNKVLEPWVFRRRTRFGTEVVYSDTVRQVVDFYDKHRVPCALMMLSDQCPSDVHKSYWTTFFHQETPFLYGAENFARRYNYPVLYYRVDKVRRGRYTVTFSLLCEDPQAVPQYTIEERYIRTLEADIAAKPEYWLWSHRRWKRKRPADVPLHPATSSNTNPA